jgi:hypothetical protein
MNLPKSDRIDRALGAVRLANLLIARAAEAERQGDCATALKTLWTVVTLLSLSGHHMTAERIELKELIAKMTPVSTG